METANSQTKEYPMTSQFVANGTGELMNNVVYKDHIIVELPDGFYIFSAFGIQYNQDPFLDIDHAKKWIDEDLATADGKKVLS
jgi:hypothetical protein